MKKGRVTNHIRHPLLLHEACVLSLLRGHPNIPRVFAWGRSQYFEYMAMELLGPDLEDFVSIAGLSQRNAVALLDALEYIHGKGIVHCDVKPANICLGRGENAGRLYLIDFGLAWRFTSGSSTTKGWRGTVPYCSLRVLSGEAALPRDDLESLAYTLARLSIGHLPWAFLPYDSDRGTVRGAELFQGHPAVFASFLDFALGLSPTDDLQYQYQRWRDAFRALEPGLGLPEHQCPVFDQQDRRSGERLWVPWSPPPTRSSSEESDQVFVAVEGGRGGSAITTTATYSGGRNPGRRRGEITASTS
ncbi:transporter [Ganoderma sinense ZZ0214-1]|uniref:non-specific serine/threonine protein kinase n=1 Tax=Ganoderma sinense ZZ0214-1 TaxID=1077348 RepID=A0A2G8RZN7_9APHY|nr:transporter [Ganoderma sinense ZZ0214-1]